MVGLDGKEWMSLFFFGMDAIQLHLYLCTLNHSSPVLPSSSLTQATNNAHCLLFVPYSSLYFSVRDANLEMWT